MSTGSDPSARKRAKRSARDERLAAALRDNLRWRKDQTRARETHAAVPDVPSSSDARGLSGAAVSSKSNRHGGTTAD
ncbi:MAG: hypothetical protein ACREDL_05795 [Bradyrhizobium sp.]